LIEVLDDHAACDEMKAVVRERQMVDRSAEQWLDCPVRTNSGIHSEDEPASRGKPVFERIHVIFEQA
jgi:hypothetical protein